MSISIYAEQILFASLFIVRLSHSMEGTRVDPQMEISLFNTVYIRRTHERFGIILPHSPH